jgi:hypothetical protein
MENVNDSNPIPTPTPTEMTTGVIPMLLMMAGIPIGATVLGALRWLLDYLGI